MPFEISQKQGGSKIQNLMILTKSGHIYRLDVTRGFHIWSQNLNRIAIGQKMVENGISIEYFSQFRSILAKRGSHVVRLNFETRFEILSIFPVYMTPFC